MSRHLKILLTSGIVEDERVPEDARVRLFKLQPESLVAVQAFLDQLQAEWRIQLRSFKRHVERSRDDSMAEVIDVDTDPMTAFTVFTESSTSGGAAAPSTPMTRGGSSSAGSRAASGADW